MVCGCFILLMKETNGRPLVYPYIPTFKKMKNFMFLKVGGYMKTIVSKNYLDRIIELYGTPDIKIIFIDFMDLEFEEIKECPSLFCGATLCDR